MEEHTQQQRFTDLMKEFGIEVTVTEGEFIEQHDDGTRTEKITDIAVGPYGFQFDEAGCFVGIDAEQAVTVMPVKVPAPDTE